MTRWTPDEEEILRGHYSKRGPVGCLDLLNGRTVDAIRVHATSSLGLRSPKALAVRWGSTEDVARLRRFAAPRDAPAGVSGRWCGADELLRILLKGPAMENELRHLPADFHGLVHALNCSLAPTQRHIVSRLVKARTRLGWLRLRRYELIEI